MGGIDHRYDQRVVVYAELTGDAEDRQKAERAFEEMGWPVLRKDHEAEYTMPAKLGYVLEVRLMGARWRSGHAAHWPVIGGHLEPSRPYLSFGVVDGSVALWDPKTKSPIKVPSDAVSLIPVEDHRAPVRSCP